jgi:predicted protein tyrosine phosphatase
MNKIIYEDGGRISNVHNFNQSYFEYPRVLCVCLGGLLRSPTIAWVLSNEPYNCNTRACGIDDRYALVLADNTLLKWAEMIVTVETEHFAELRRQTAKPIFNLEIPDRFTYRDPKLVRLIQRRLEETGFPKNILLRDELINV